MVKGWWSDRGLYRFDDGQLLEVDFSVKPIPHRDFDWSVCALGADPDAPGFFSGNGSTLALAVEDWLAQHQEGKDMEAES